MVINKMKFLLLLSTLLVSPVSSATYLGTDLCFTHILKNRVKNSTLDAMPNFNLYLLKPINNYSLFIADVHYQWNFFVGGYFRVLKFKADLGLKQESSRVLTTEYLGMAPSWLFFKSEYTETFGTYYSTYTVSHKISKISMAMDFIVGFRQIFRQNRFFSFGWTAEYSYLVPFFDISSIFIEELFGLNCVKAGFSFTFHLPEK